MKTSIILLMIALISSLTDTMLYGQWTKLNRTTEHPIVYAFLENDIEMIAAGHEGIFRWSESDTMWVSTLNVDDVNGLIRQGTTLFAAVDNRGIYRSDDNGLLWLQVNTDQLHYYLNGLASIDSTLFLASYGYGVLTSSNYGKTWRSLNGGLPNSYAFSFCVDGKKLYVSMAGGQVLSTTNLGLNWVNISSGLPASQVRCLTLHGSNLFAGTEDSGIYRLTEGDTEWTEVSIGLMNRGVRSIVSNGSRLFAGTKGGVCLSIDNGAHWEDISNGIAKRFTLVLGISGPYLYSSNAGETYRRRISDIQSVGVEETSTSPFDIDVSPIPTKGLLSFQPSREVPLIFSIHNVLGVEVVRQTQAILPRHVLDVTALPSGLYFARFVSATSIVTKTIVVE